MPTRVTLTRTQLKTAVLGIGLAATTWACAPPNAIPVAPPGMEYKPVLVESEEDRAQALGEMQGTAHVLPEAGTTVSPVEPAKPTAVGQPVTTATGLVYETLTPGQGPEALAGKRVYVHYTGTLQDGTVFDSSRESGRPFQFVIGAGGVIRGWDQGVAGMLQGERRKLTIPPDLAYGSTPPSPKIPPDSTLIFDIELIRVE